MKRQKERARQEKQRDKDASRVDPRKEKDLRTSQTPGEDPDIAGIVPGPLSVSATDRRSCGYRRKITFVADCWIQSSSSSS